MPSSDRKFLYQGSTPTTDADEVCELQECSRSRTRSFTRSIDNTKRESSNDSSEDVTKGGVCASGNVNKVPVTRRVSWADQSPYTDETSASSSCGTIKIKYMSSVSAPERSTVDELKMDQDTDIVTPADLTKLVQIASSEPLPDEKDPKEDKPPSEGASQEHKPTRGILKKVSSQDTVGCSEEGTFCSV